MFVLLVDIVLFCVLLHGLDLIFEHFANCLVFFIWDFFLVEVGEDVSVFLGVALEDVVVGLVCDDFEELYPV